MRMREEMHVVIPFYEMKLQNNTHTNRQFISPAISHVRRVYIQYKWIGIQLTTPPCSLCQKASRSLTNREMLSNIPKTMLSSLPLNQITA